MKRLSKEQILMLHSQLIEQTGGTVGVRDFNLLESAIETPFKAKNTCDACVLCLKRNRITIYAKRIV